MFKFSLRTFFILFTGLVILISSMASCCKKYPCSYNHGVVHGLEHYFGHWPENVIDPLSETKFFYTETGDITGVGGGYYLIPGYRVRIESKSRVADICGRIARITARTIVKILRN